MHSPGRFRMLTCSTVFALSSLVASCSDDAAEKKQLLSTISSWASSAVMIVEAKAGETVPLGYTKIAIESCGDQIADLRTQLDAIDNDPQINDAVGEVQTSIEAVRVSLSSSDKGSIEKALRNLRDSAAALRRLSGAR